MIDLLASIEQQRGIPLPLMLEAVEEALTAAARIELKDAQIVVSVDRTTGNPQVFRRRAVVETVNDPLTETAPGLGYEPGDFMDEPVDAQNFGRRAALTAREIVARRVIEFERDRVFNKYRELEGTLIHALVQRVEGGHVYALLDRQGNEAVLPREHYEGTPPAINEWIFCVVDGVRKTARGPAIFLSRASENFISALLPGWPIVTVAREPGVRTLVAVSLNGSEEPDPTVLPAAERELGEPITWCDFSDDLPSFVASAIAALGGDVSSVIVEPDAVLVAPTDVDLGLVSRLVGTNLYGTDDVAGTRQELEAQRFANALQEPVVERRESPVVMTDEQIAILQRFRDERLAGG